MTDAAASGSEPVGHARVSPPTVAHGIVRSSLVERLGGRWDHAVTTVVAGAGFGKSIALGQAMRANQARPRGIEAWVSCRIGCEDPGRFAVSVRRAFGATTGIGRPPLRAVLDVVDHLAPVEVTLMLDDVEALSEVPLCVDLLDRLIRSAPPGLHLVLAGRTLPPVRLARLRAAGQVLAVGEAALRFTDADVVALADRLGTPVPRRDLGGWPALVRLALTSPEGVDDFLGEEVVDALAVRDRRALLALGILGPSSPADVAAVCSEPFDAEGFCARVPLVHRVGGAVAAHALWEPAGDLLGSPGEIAELSRRALVVVEERGDPVATGMLARRLGDQVALERAAVGLVRTTLGSLPLEVAGVWLAALAGSGDGGEGPASPAAELLACALDHVADAARPTPERLDAVLARCRAAGDVECESVAVALAALVADARRDLGHLLTLAGRARELADSVERPDPLVRLLVVAVDAALAAATGDLDGALAHLERPIEGLRARERPEAVGRLHWHLLLLAGRATEAAERAADIVPAAPAAVRRELDGVARWFDGDPSALLSGEVTADATRYASLSERDRFDQAAFAVGLAASVGDVEAVDLAADILTSSPFATAVPADAALVAVGRATRAIVHHDEAAATTALDDLVTRHPLEGPVDVFLRRSPAVGYVMSARLRRRWDAATLGPSLRRACGVARLLVDARTGRPPGPAPDPLVAAGTALPLPWSVELATRAAGRGVPWGTALAEELADRFGRPVHAELRRLATTGDRAIRRGVEVIRRALPTRPPGDVEVRVIGPLEVWRDGRIVDAPELRRARVRELLGALVLEGSITRDRAIDLLWPGHDLDKARANLRVTLGHLRRLLEPDRGPGDAPYFVRADAAQVRLAAVEGLTVDLWATRHELAGAEAARREGDAEMRTRHLAAAVDRWRGRPLPDLDAVDDLAQHARHLAVRLGDAALELGELELVRDGPGRAADRAERALAADPYDERAHRLALAAALQGRDRAAAHATLARLHDRLGELGTDPDATTAMLLRQAQAWLGPRPPAADLP